MQPAPAPEAFMGLLCVILGVVVAVALVIAIFYLLTLQKALSRVSPQNRLMEPAMVWLSLVPCFNLIWQFFVAQRVPDSLRNEFRSRGRDDGSDYGKSIGLTVAVLNVLSTFANFAGRGFGQEASTVLGCVFGLMGIFELVLFIMFWVKIANYSNQLAMAPDQREDWLRRFEEDEFDRGEHGGREPPPGSLPPPSDQIKEGDQGQYQ